MSDLGEYWRDVKPVLKQMGMKRRDQNKASSAALLTERGFQFESKNDGTHLIVKHAGKVADFWPSTGLWIVRGSKRGRGVFGLMEKLNKL